MGRIKKGFRLKIFIETMVREQNSLAMDIKKGSKIESMNPLLRKNFYNSTVSLSVKTKASSLETPPGFSMY